MPILDFKDEASVYAHHRSAPLRELVVEAKKSLPAAGAKPSLEGKLIQRVPGD